MKIFHLNYIIILFFASQASAAQQLDTAAVIRIAKHHAAFIAKNANTMHQVSYDSVSGVWTSVSVQYKHISRGECRHTNGCTRVKQVCQLIDDKKRKVISRKTSKTVFPNYE